MKADTMALVAISLLLPAVALALPLEQTCPTCKDWELLANVTIEGTFPVLKYKSTRTNMTVVLGDNESPIVHGYFCLATEAFTDDGLPHTLEHLIFQGSEDYPYYSTLDLIAKRCLARGTNAWTQTDATCYTVQTAGSSGFLNILPIYMDHILYPLLTKNNFITEVHHVKGDGEDAGVVYSEMQAKENTPGPLMFLEFTRLLYPNATSYAAITGGKLENLRQSTSIENIRKYHKKYYRPENLYVTVSGRVKQEEIINALAPLEAKILGKRQVEGEPEPLERPFHRDYPDLEGDVDKTYEYPNEDEKFGRVYMGWRLPGLLTETLENRTALAVMAAYLTGTDVSPMKKSFVNIPKPLATSVSIGPNSKLEPALSMAFGNVPVEKIDEIEPKFKQVIQQLVDDGPEKFEIKTIHLILDNMIEKRKENLENGPHFLLPGAALLDLLYSVHDGDFNRLVVNRDESEAKQLRQQPASFWLGLIQDTFSLPRVLLKGVPSKALSTTLHKTEEDRVKKQIEEMGVEGLKAAGNEVQAAIDAQTFPPNSVLKSVPMANVDTIAYMKLSQYNYTTAEQPKDFDLQGIPFRFHFYDIKSQVVRFYVFLDMESIPQRDRPYVVLLYKLWLKCPEKRPDGTVIPLKQVIINRAEIAPTFYVTLSGKKSHLMYFYAETKLENYPKAIQMVKDAMFNVQFSAEKAKTLISQYLNTVPAYKNSASTVASALLSNIYFDDKVFLHHESFLRQKVFLEGVKKQLETDPQVVLDKLYELRDMIVNPRMSFVHMATDLKSLTDTYKENASKVWDSFYDKSKFVPLSGVEKSTKHPITPDSHYRDPSPDTRHAIVGLKGTESCYFYQAIDFDNGNWESKEVAAVRVMLKYLSRKLFDQIRGQGWTYGVSMGASVATGRLKLQFIKATSMANAYKEFRGILANYTDNESVWDPVLLDSSVGSLIYSYVSGESTLETLFHSAVSSYLRNADDSNYAHRFIKQLSMVTVEEVRAVAKKYLPVFADPTRTHTSVVCSPKQVDDVMTLMRDEYDFDLNHIQDLDNSILTE